MSRRWPLGLLTLGALVVPAAPASAKSYELTATGRGADGFTLTLRHAPVYDYPILGGFAGHDKQPSFYDRGSVVLSRTRKGQTLRRRLAAAKPAKITAARNLKSARVRMGFATRGRVDLRFTPTGKLKKMGPDNCNASQLHGRRGVFRGTFTVKLGGAFHTLRRTTFRGTLAIDATGDDCSDPIPTGGDRHLRVADRGISATFYDVGGGLGRLSLPGGHGRGWRLFDEIDVDGHAAFSADVARDAMGRPVTASGHAQAGGPFVTGALDWGPQAVTGVVTDGETFDAAGPVRGSLTVIPKPLGARVVMRPATGRLGEECEQCI